MSNPIKTTAQPTHPERTRKGPPTDRQVVAADGKSASARFNHNHPESHPDPDTSAACSSGAAPPVPPRAPGACPSIRFAESAGAAWTDAATATRAGDATADSAAPAAGRAAAVAAAAGAACHGWTYDAAA